MELNLASCLWRLNSFAGEYFRYLDLKSVAHHKSLEQLGLRIIFSRRAKA